MTNRDQIYLTKAIDLALDHSSGGSYNMVALWVKGSNVIAGNNILKRLARHENETYPEICGFHAELDLYKKSPNMRGGTIYVGGRKRTSNSIMINTKPCEYCATLLMTTKVNWVVYLHKSRFIKNRIDELL